MQGLLVRVLLLAGLCGLLSAGPSVRRSLDRPSPSLSQSFHSYLLGAGLVNERETHGLFKRQMTGVCTTNNNSDCYPPGINSVPSALIECLAGGVCSCQECFEMGPNGTCVDVSCEDWRYDTRDLNCRDDRPSQLTAFLLSFFLSSTGAANFYIGRDDLGGGQLFLLILLLSASYITCYLPCCLGCCMAKDDVKGSVVFIALMVIEVVVMLLVMLAVWAWWIADLVIFATNQRDAGNGCMLRENL